MRACFFLCCCNVVIWVVLVFSLRFASAFRFDRCNEMYVSVEQSRVLDTSLSVFRCFPTHTHMFIIYRMKTSG